MISSINQLDQKERSQTEGDHLKHNRLKAAKLLSNKLGKF